MKVLISDTISDEGLKIFKETPQIQVDVATGLKPEELKARIGEYQGLVVRSATKVTAEIIEAASSLMVIGRAGIGVDNVDVEAASRKGVLVMNTPAGNRVTTAEHTIALMLALCREVPAADASMRAGRWEKGSFIGVEVCDKTIGIIGLGNIGSVVARLARGLDMKVLAYDLHLSPEAIRATGAEPATFDDLISRSDFITIHTPLSPSTRGLIGREAFGKMKEGVRIINCARGGIVDEAALVDALQSGKAAGAALDVFEKEPLPADHPFLKMGNVVLTPHIGAATHEAQRKCGIDVARQVIDYLLTGAVTNSVNYPSLDASEKKRQEPYLKLIERLAALHAQLFPAPAGSFEIALGSGVADLNHDLLSRAALVGLIKSATGRAVNTISAPVLAGEVGMAVAVAPMVSAEGPDLIGFASAGATADKGVTGFLAGGPYLAGIMGHGVRVPLEGCLLIISHLDGPDWTAGLANCLAKGGAAARLIACDRKPGGVLTLVQLDQVPPKGVLDDIQELPGVTHCTFACF